MGAPIQPMRRADVRHAHMRARAPTPHGSYHPTSFASRIVATNTSRAHHNHIRMIGLRLKYSIAAPRADICGVGIMSHPSVMCIERSVQGVGRSWIILLVQPGLLMSSSSPEDAMAWFPP